MRLIMTFLFITLGILCFAQGGYLRPNTSFGTREYRKGIDSAFHYPTGDGLPSLRGSTLKQGALYFDSTNNKVYNYNPKTNTWSSLLNGNDTLFIHNKLFQTFNNAKFDTSARVLELYRVNGDSLSVLIPAGSGGGSSGATDFSWNVTGNTVTQLWNNGANHSFDKSDARISNGDITNWNGKLNASDTTNKWVQNRLTSQQPTSNFWISGQGRIDNGLVVNKNVQNISSSIITAMSSGSRGGGIMLGNTTGAGSGGFYAELRGITKYDSSQGNQYASTLITSVYDASDTIGKPINFKNATMTNGGVILSTINTLNQYFTAKPTDNAFGIIRQIKSLTEDSTIRPYRSSYMLRMGGDANMQMIGKLAVAYPLTDTIGVADKPAQFIKTFPIGRAAMFAGTVSGRSAISDSDFVIKGQLATATVTSFNGSSGAITFNPTLQTTTINGNATNSLVFVTGANNIPTTGAGVEIAASGFSGYVSAINRNNGFYYPLTLQGGNNTSATSNKLVIDANMTYNGSQVWYNNAPGMVATSNIEMQADLKIRSLTSANAGTLPSVAMAGGTTGTVSVNSTANAVAGTITVNITSSVAAGNAICTFSFATPIGVIPHVQITQWQPQGAYLSSAGSGGFTLGAISAMSPGTYIFEYFIIK